MLPYFEQPGWTLGPFTIHAYGLLVVTAILMGWRLTVWRAGQVGLDPAVASRMCRLMVLAGFAGAWLARTQIYAPGTWGGVSSFGGLVAGLMAALLLLRRSGKTLNYLDAVAYVFPAAWMIGRAGCAVSHDHPGILANGFLTVRFPGGPRYDLGLIEMLFMIPVALLFLALDRRPQRAGFFTGVFLVIYGPFRIALDRLHTTPNADLWFGAAATLAGLALLFHARRGGQVSDSLSRRGLFEEKP